LGETAADQALPSQYRKRPCPPPGSGYHPGFALTRPILCGERGRPGDKPIVLRGAESASSTSRPRRGNRAGCQEGFFLTMIIIEMLPEDFGFLAVDLQLLQGVAGRLHEFGLGIGDRGVVET
jgi:hypothetical protein